MICDTIFSPLIFLSRLSSETDLKHARFCFCLDGIDVAVFKRLLNLNMRFQSKRVCFHLSINVAILEPVTCYKATASCSFRAPHPSILEKHLTMYKREEKQRNMFVFFLLLWILPSRSRTNVLEDWKRPCPAPRSPFALDSFQRFVTL